MKIVKKMTNPSTLIMTGVLTAFSPIANSTVA